MVAVPYVEVGSGWPLHTYRVAAINLLGNDVPGPNPSDAAHISISPGIGGGPGYSYERWLRVGFDGPFTTIRDLAMFLDHDPTDAWSVQYGVTATYQRPSKSASKIAVHPIPLTSVNIGTGPSTPPVHSLWVVIQAMVVRESGASMELDFQFSWTED